ncbi:MAG: glycosyltransferase [Pseudomonadota bacterium]
MTAPPQPDRNCVAHHCIALCTRQDGAHLDICLAAITAQVQMSALKVSLVLVENSHHRTCDRIISQLKQRNIFHSLSYMTEPNPGIPAARNTSIDEALRLKADWIIFIDDDEFPETGWLQNLTAARRQFSADVYHGPVRLLYPPNQPKWLQLKSFDGGQHGSYLSTAATNNTMVSRRIFCTTTGLGLRFDNAYRFTGGSDVALFYMATKRGAKIRWVANAIVNERQDGERLKSEWLARRSQRIAANAVHRHMSERPIRSILKTATTVLRLSTEVIAYSVLYVSKRAVSLTHQPANITKHLDRQNEIRFRLQVRQAKISGYIRGIVRRPPQPYLVTKGHTPPGYQSPAP